MACLSPRKPDESSSRILPRFGPRLPLFDSLLFPLSSSSFQLFLDPLEASEYLQALKRFFFSPRGVWMRFDDAAIHHQWQLFSVANLHELQKNFLPNSFFRPAIKARIRRVAGTIQVSGHIIPRRARPMNPHNPVDYFAISLARPPPPPPPRLGQTRLQLFPLIVPQISPCHFFLLAPFFPYSSSWLARKICKCPLILFEIYG